MSLRSVFGEDYINLEKTLEPYIESLGERDEHLTIKGKTLEIANREQSSWLSFYDERRIELTTYVRFFEMEEKRIRGTLFKSYLEHYPRDLGERAIEKYIDIEQAYLEIHEKLLAVKELATLYESAVDAFKARGYALNNITRIRVASLEDVVI